MFIEIVRGQARNRQQASMIANTVAEAATDGTVYIGYPVLSSIEDRVHVDVLLISRAHGLVGFQGASRIPSSPEEWAAVVADQDRLFLQLETSLGRYESLRRGRRLAIDVRTATVFPTSPRHPPESQEGIFVGLADVPKLIEGLNGLDEALYVRLSAALQRVSTLKPAKRRSSVTRSNSRGATIKKIEQEIANLDQWQNAAAIEAPDGPQRIRGLAGSGKTVVLALKAAYLHIQNPEWRIASTFFTRSLYQHITGLVRRFTFEHNNDEPDFDRLQIEHAWGSHSSRGVYSDIARHLDLPVRDFRYGTARYGREGAFAGVCDEILVAIGDRAIEPLYDAVLIDEAQDLPTSFFRLVYAATREPKRIVWAYDEMQQLSEASMPSAAELFGHDANGEPLVTLTEAPGQARQDITLPTCYRNTPWALVTAHALGLGIYRPEGLVQYVDDARLWSDIGYRVAAGRLEPGHAVTLQRRADSYPPYFDELLNPTDAVTCRAFTDSAAQDRWVAEQIDVNLTTDELEHDDILIVLPNPITARERGDSLRRVLAQRRIPSHLVGVTSGSDEVFQPGSVAMAHIFRAKGNEAPMVYAVDGQEAESRFALVRHRNTLFTAITRSRAWVRVTAHGPHAAQVEAELEAVRDNGYALAFTVPTHEMTEKMRRINRDRSEEEIVTVQKAERTMSELAALLGERLDPDDLDPEVRRRLLEVLEAHESDTE